MKPNNTNLYAFAYPEIITSFDSVLNDFINNSFPDMTNSFGQDFYVKGSYPKVNILETKNSVVIEASVPGLKKEDINITLKDKFLTISGDSNQSLMQEEGAKYVMRELKKSKFQRTFSIGDIINKEKITAECCDGILKIELPKYVADERTDLPKKIAIK